MGLHDLQPFFYRITSVTQFNILNKLILFRLFIL